MTTYKVGYFVGSLSSTSINRELAKALIRLWIDAALYALASAARATCHDRLDLIT